jgi:Flagellar hook-length control protein FliK
LTPISLATPGFNDLVSAPSSTRAGNNDDSFASYLKKSREDDQQESTDRSTAARKQRTVKDDKDSRGHQRQDSDTSDAAPDTAAAGPQAQDPSRSLLPSLRIRAEAVASGAKPDSIPAADGAKNGERSDAQVAPKGSIAFSVTATEKLSQSWKGKHSDMANHGDEHAAPAIKSAAAEAVQKLQAPAPVRNVIAASPTVGTGSQQAQTAYTTNQISKPTAPTAASQVSEVADLPQTPQLRPHSIDLKVGGSDSQVDVRISQRAGDVQVTVRTPDGDLAQSLRQHLPELSERLAQNGVHGDIWHPTGAVSAPAETDNSGSQSWNGDDSNRQQQAQDHNQRSNQNQQDSRQSAWLNELNQADKEPL